MLKKLPTTAGPRTAQMRGDICLFLARADARAGGGEGVYRHPSLGPDDGPVYGPRRQLVGAARQDFATSAMRVGVWDQTSHLVIKINNNN